jgi:hypothetical protein
MQDKIGQFVIIPIHRADFAFLYTRHINNVIIFGMYKPY